MLSLALLAGCEGQAPAAGAGFALEEATIEEIHQAYTRGELSAVQLTGAYLERIEAHDQGAHGLHAIVSLQPGSLLRAEALDASFARTHAFVGPLHGIPILIEDNLDTFDLPTSAGLLALAESVPPDDAFVVQRLRAAGAIILGKTNMMELGASSAESCSSAGALTRNAYDATRSSPGAGCGSAVAVAANFATAAVATDPSASFVDSAAANGVVGLRPSFGLVSRDGMVTGLDQTTMAGPIARTVEDAALLLEVMQGEDPADPVTHGVARDRASVPVREDGLQGTRVGLVRELAESSTFGGVSAPVDKRASQLLIRALGALRGAGAKVSGVSIAAIDQQVTPLLARRHEDNPLAFFIDGYLASLGPDAKVHSLAELAASGAMLPELVAPRGEAAPSAVPPIQSEAQLEASRGRVLLRDLLVGLMDAQKRDVLVYLTIASTAQLSGQESGGSYGVAGQLSAFSGMPSVTVPIGTVGGLPLGLTMLGRPFQDAQLLSIARAFEQATRYRVAPTVD